MWKKDEGPSEPAVTTSSARSSGSRSTSSGRATIGPSISIRGDVTGSEDLVIEGQVDGSVTLDKHSVSVGSEGRVNANIEGRVITVEGTVEGDLTAREQIVLRGTARVLGDIKAPRVVLEDGATFRGLVDMAAAPANGNYPGPESKAGKSGSESSGGSKAKSAPAAVGAASA